jgi:uncharacterized protein (TIGR03435 family)
MRYVLGFVLIVAMFVPAMIITAAQNQPLKFEVASIKERPFTPGVMGVEFQSGGRMVAMMAPLPLLITSAYGILPAQLQFSPNLPDAALKLFYDIEAKPEANAIPSGRVSRESARKLELMLQTLLADRFKLKMHTEKRELPIYALVVDRGGLKLQKASDRDCAATPSPCHWVTVGPASGAIGQSVTLESLAAQLTGFTDRDLVDKTGITGTFDIHLPPFSRGAPTPGTIVDGAPVDLSAPSLASVLHEVGLRLEPQKQVLDVYVVDHIERPSAN